MIIIRINQENSVVHTDFALLPDYKVMPRTHYELAKQWAEAGLLDKFSASFMALIENQRNYYTAIRRCMEWRDGNAAGLQLVPRRSADTGRNPG